MGVYACYDRICVDYHLYDGMTVIPDLPFCFTALSAHTFLIGFGVFTCY